MNTRTRLNTGPHNVWMVAVVVATMCAFVGILRLAAPAGAAATATAGRGSPGQAVSWASLFPPRVESLRRCDTFEAAVEVWNAADVAAFELQIGYDPAVVEFTAASVAPWLSERWSAFVELPPIETNGNVLFAAAADPGAGSATGDGELAHVTFTAVGAGTTSLDLHDVRLIDTAGAVLPITSTGAVAVVLNEDGSGCVATPTITPSTTPGTTPGTATTPAGSVTPTRTGTNVPSRTRTATSTPTETATREPTPGSPQPTTPSSTPTGTGLLTLTPSATASLGSGTQVPSPETPTSGPPIEWLIFLPDCRVP